MSLYCRVYTVKVYTAIGPSAKEGVLVKRAILLILYVWARGPSPFATRHRHYVFFVNNANSTVCPQQKAPAGRAFLHHCRSPSSSAFTSQLARAGKSLVAGHNPQRMTSPQALRGEPPVNSVALRLASEKAARLRSSFPCSDAQWAPRCLRTRWRLRKSRH